MHLPAHTTVQPGTVATVWRIQDKDGRGPYKPGVSVLWCDDRDPDHASIMHPSIMEEFGNDLMHQMRALAFTEGFHLGCGFRTRAQLDAWFSTMEQMKLLMLGYHITAHVPDKIVAESPRQLVFASRMPLKLSGVILL